MSSGHYLCECSSRKPYRQVRSARCLYETVKRRPSRAARERISQYRDTGIDRLLLQDFLPRDTDHIAVMGELIR